MSSRCFICDLCAYNLAGFGYLSLSLSGSKFEKQ